MYIFETPMLYPAKTQPQSLYHGTSTVTELGIGDILLPPDQTNVISETNRKRNLNLVFLTPMFNYAKIYAGRTVRSLGGNPIIFEVEPVNLQLYKAGSGDTIFVCDSAKIIRTFVLPISSR